MKAAFSAVTIATLLLISSAQAQTAIAVSMTNYAFTPGMLMLKAGQTYRIHFSNDANKSHDFCGPGLLPVVDRRAGGQGQARGRTSEVELEGGQAVDITLTPNRAGTYALSCTHFMHSMLGMNGKIVVQ